jgi:hypothetical protein
LAPDFLGKCRNLGPGGCVFSALKEKNDQKIPSNKKIFKKNLREFYVIFI